MYFVFVKKQNRNKSILRMESLVELENMYAEGALFCYRDIYHFRIELPSQPSLKL